MFKQEINAVKQYFHEKNFHASDDWLHDCVSWAMTNNSPQENTIAKLHDFAYQQWLLGNLREMSPGCLPPNLQQQRLVVLNGKYSLQAEKIVDVSNPKYTQLKISKGGVIEREDEPEDEEAISELTEWGHGPRETGGKLRPRKLMLHLCDGKQEIRGLEYKSLPKLRGMIFPGIKVHVIGPIECRRGVLMLEPKHLIILGGEIDTLMVTNAPVNVIARQLGLPENPDPYKEVQSTIPEPRKEGPPTRTQNMTKSTSSSSTGIGLSQATNVTGHKPNVKSNASKQDSARSLHSQNNRSNAISSVTSSQQRSWSKPQTSAMDCDDMDDFDLTEEDLLALEKQSNLVMQSSESNRPVTKSKPTSSIPTNSLDSFDEEYLEVDLDDLESQILASSSTQINPSFLKEASANQQIKTRQNFGASGDSKAVSIGVPEKSARAPQLAKPKLLGFVEKISCPSASVEHAEPTQVIPQQQQVSRWPFVYLRQLQDPENRPHQAVVLEHFIGLSVAEVVKLKMEATVNPLAKERLTELSVVKKKLIDLVCLMEIEFFRDQMPQVVQLTNLNESHLTELNSRQVKPVS
ncbi:hypothetical protein B566_EDAN002675 [Ephemera danica]|nr:hypothetical protein B566_EDAN002675 [Ephemera danica]